MVRLESTELLNFQGPQPLKVIKGSEVKFVNENYFGTDRRNAIQRKEIIKTTNELGSPPYLIKNINQYESGDIMLEITGKNFKTKELNKDYFTQ